MSGPLILGTNSIKDTGYDVDNSLRFNSGDSSRLTRTQTSGDRNKATLSAWVKRSKLGANQAFFGIHGASSDAGQIEIRFQSSGEGFHISGQATNWRRTNRHFRDVSAWYHLVVAFDTTLSTANDRVKVYVNGVQETSFAASGNPGQNDDLPFGLNGATCTVGCDFNAGSAGNYFGGYLAEVVLIDGQQLDPTSFGEFDSDTPTVWKPKDVSGLTFGNNGFYMEFKQNGTSQNSSGMGADTSGNGNHFAVSNLTAVAQSLDTCTNNYATFNTLIRSSSGFTNGNLKYNAPASNPVFGSLTTFGVEAGKWYAEVKYLTGSNHYLVLGIADEVFATLNDLGSATNTDLGKTGSLGHSDAQNSTIAYVVNTGAYRNNNSNTSWGSGGGDGDIINIALDRDNRKVYFGVNGTYGNSSNPATGSNGIDISSLVTGNIYFLGVTNDTGASETTAEFNFGAGATTAISSGNSDANGHGNFEYAVPSGYYAWNTKNLAEFG